MEHWHLLVVDDEKEIRDIIQEFLMIYGHSVDTVSGGREAMDNIRKSSQPYDLAVVDWNMPGIAGRNVIQFLTQQSPHTKIVITTGHCGDPQMTQLALKMNIPIIQKPFSLRILRHQLQKFMNPPFAKTAS